MSTHHQLDYVELPANNLRATEAFFNAVFNWSFTYYGPDYMDCSDGGWMIGFYRAELQSQYAHGGALLTFVSQHLEKSQTLIESAGGDIVKAIFSFPGGKRFHFKEPSGNEFAVWSRN